MRDSSHLFNTYSRMDLSFEKGDGVWLITESGERYLDFAAGIAVNSLGHSHPKLVEALKTQAEKLWHVSNLYQSTGQERLAAPLVEETFADKVFFTNSGAEALECAIKTTRRYYHEKGEKYKFCIITFEEAFHGRTLATIAAGGQSKYLDGFGPKVDGFDQVPFGNIETLKATVTSATAAILIEPTEGEGGIRKATPEFLQNLRKICNDIDALLIFDEVQTGIGRTGKLFAYEWANIRPDIMTIAKGLGGGFPIGACLATDAVSSCMIHGSHGSTYGGNCLAMAVGQTVLDIILADGFLKHVCNIADIFYKGLILIRDRFPDVLEEVRGQGLMVGLKTVNSSKELVKAMLGERLLTAPASDNVVRLLPPLTITAEELHEGLARIARAALILSTNRNKQK